LTVPTEHIDTVIIGAGQSGLTASYHLSRKGVSHVVLERGRVGERWRSERWDNLHFQFPASLVRLPGFPYEGDAPDSFIHRDHIVQKLERYAQRIATPVRCGATVRRVCSNPDGERGKTPRLLVDLDSHTIVARNVICATGPYQAPNVPSVSKDISPGVMQLTANRYTNHEQLPAGAVLVVGAGSSGYQIAEDLCDYGRRVFLSVGRHRGLPRRYRGKDFGHWLEETGAADQSSEDIPRGRPTVLMSGYRGGEKVDVRWLAQRGVTIVGRLQKVDGDTLQFTQDLDSILADTDQGLANFKELVDEYLAREGLLDTAPPPEQMTAPPPLGPTPATLDLTAEDIRTVIWSTGYTFDLGWAELPVKDDQGAPQHRQGVTAVAGFYFIGLQYLRKFRSALFWGSDEDAAYLAEKIAAGE
jgi:putative flavoprotein involved in K+ transport